MGYDRLEHELIIYDQEAKMESRDHIIEIWKSDLTEAKLIWWLVGAICGLTGSSLIWWILTK